MNNNCWKPDDYDILWKAFRLAVMTALTFGDFIIYSNDDVTKIMEWFLKQAKERNE